MGKLTTTERQNLAAEVLHLQEVTHAALPLQDPGFVIRVRGRQQDEHH